MIDRIQTMSEGFWISRQLWEDSQPGVMNTISARFTRELLHLWRCEPLTGDYPRECPNCGIVFQDPRPGKVARREMLEEMERLDAKMFAALTPEEQGYWDEHVWEYQTND